MHDESRPVHAAPAVTTAAEAPVEIVDNVASVLSWEQARMRHSLPVLVRRAMRFTAQPAFDDALIDAVKDYYGLDMDVATAESEILEDDDERIRFFPWFLWDWRPADGGPTVGERFLAAGGMARYERSVVEALCTSYVGFYQAVTDASSAGVSLSDMATGDVIWLADEGLTGELAAGEILQARLVRVAGTDAPVVLIDAVYAVLPAKAHIAVARELAGLPLDLGPVPRLLELYAAEMLEFAEHLLERLAQPPVALNGDGERLMLCQSTLRGAPARQCEHAVATAPAFTAVLDGLWRWTPDGTSRGFIRRTRDGRLILGASSAERLTTLESEIGALGGVEIPPMRSITDFASEAERWTEGTGSEPWLRTLPDVATAMRSWVDAWARRQGDAQTPGLQAPHVVAALARLERQGL